MPRGFVPIYSFTVETWAAGVPYPIMRHTFYATSPHNARAAFRRHMRDDAFLHACFKKLKLRFAAGRVLPPAALADSSSTAVPDGRRAPGKGQQDLARSGRPAAAGKGRQLEPRSGRPAAAGKGRQLELPSGRDAGVVSGRALRKVAAG